MSGADEPRYVPGQLAVKLTSDTLAKVTPSIPPKGGGSKVTRFGVDSIDRILERFGVRGISRLALGAFLIEVPPETNLVEVKNLLKGDLHVMDVDLNYLARTSE